MSCFALLMCAYANPSPASAVAGINQQINFQGRLLNSQGATVPDGYYNIQFKIYQDGPGTAVGNPGGTLMWTESHLNNNSQGVVVKNGFLSVQLGSINAFGSQVDWNQDTIWLSMNIGNTNVSCTPFSSCAPDGEMVPMKRMAATPYSLNSGLLNGLASTNFVQLAQGVQTDASSGPSSIFINKTNTGNLLQLQSSGSDAFTVDNAGDLTFGAAANHTISVTTAAASTAGKQLTVSAGGGGSGAGSVGGDLVLQGGAAGGTNANGGNVTLNAGTKTGTGIDGTISVGTINTSSIQIGATTGTATQNIAVGNNNTAGSTTNVTVGAGGAAAAGTTTIQSKDNTTIATNGTTRATFDTSGTLYVGDGTTSASTGTFTIQGSTGAASNAGYNLALLGGTGGSNGNGGDITLQGGSGAGTGVQGQVKLSAGGYTTTTIGAYGSNTTISQAAVDGYSSIAISASTGGLTITVPAPTTKYDGRVLYIQLTGSNSITLSPNGGSSTSMSTNSVYALVWNTALNGWLAAGTDSNGFIQNQNSADQTANFRISGVGQANNGFTGPSLDTVAAAGTLTLGGTNATTVNVGNSTAATAITLQGGTSGTAIGIQSGVAGTISVGTANAANTIAIGSSSLSSGTQTITIGGANTAGGTQNVTVGSDSGAAAGATTIQSKDNVAIKTNGTARATFDTSGNLYLGNNITASSAGTFVIQATGGDAAGVNGSALTVQGGTGGATATGGALTLNAGAGGSANGVLSLGIANTASVSIGAVGLTTTINGHLTIATGQNFTMNSDVITDLTGSGLTLAGTSLAVDASSATGFFRNGGNSFGTGATLGTNDSNTLALRTNGTTRATFASGSNTLYVGNGDATGLAASPNSFTIQATSNSSTGAGGALTIQAGGSGASANGANLTLSSGTGGNSINGQVVISTPTFQAYGGALQKCTGAATTMALTQPSIDNFGTVSTASDSTANCVISVPNPSITTAGRVLYITADNTSTSSFVLSINGGGAGNLVAMRANSSATLVWNGAKWAPAGASSSTTLQAAYDNTIQSSGGAELIISKTASTNGLTIRDDLTNSVNGALVNIQSKTAANLFSVNSNVTDYASNPGAETQGASGSTFPSSTWSSYGTGASIARNTTTSNNSIATGQASAAVTTSGGSSANTGVQNQLVDSSGAALALLANNHYNVSFSVRLPDGASTFSDLNVRYQYDGTAGNTVTCTTGKVVAQNVWTKVNCSFTTPSAGITSANVIRIEQGSTASRTFYVDNLSVTISADYSLATDGSVDAALGSNWNVVNGSSILRSTTYGNNASSSVEVTTSTTTNQGVNNLLSIKPLANTLYRVTAYIASTTNMSGAFDIRYSPDNGSTFVSCEDYNTSTISTSLTAFTKVTCYIPTGATTVTTPYVYFRKTDATARVFYVDTFSMTLAAPSTPNVQIGSGTNGGPTTLFTLDRGASAPIAGDNESLLGSMYYDTTLGKLQCYEADGWGACGSSPDNIITISPEYTNAVMHGTGVGTMISDLCSGALDINDPTNGPQICSETETKNFYNWTSPQATSQTYSIYVTYQLPNTFKSFTSGSTSLEGRVSSTSNANVNYSIYKSTGSSLTQCGSSVSVAGGAANAWETKVASGAADPSACGFAAGNSIVFKISMSANSNANAYIGNIGFTFSNN